MYNLLRSCFTLVIAILPSVAYAGYPTHFPATMFSSAKYPTAQQTQAYVGNPLFWGDVCRTDLTVNRTIADAGSGIWMKLNAPGLGIQMSKISQRRPDGLGASIDCNHNNIYMSYIYYQDSLFTTPVSAEIEPVVSSAAGWVPFSQVPSALNFADRPGNSYAMIVKFAPMFGDWQELRLKFDNIAPVIESNWEASAPAGSSGFYNRAQLRKSPTEYLKIKIMDPETAPGVIGSGLWRVKGAFDTVQTKTGGTGHVLNECNTSPGPPITATIANPFDTGGACTADAHPDSGLAREGVGSGVDLPYEIRYNLNWGNATFGAETGSYSDGVHVAHLWAMDMAHNELTSLYTFATDNNGPCDATSHSCSLTINGAGVNATNNPSLNLLLTASDGIGSQIAASSSLELRYRFVGSSDPRIKTCQAGDYTGDVCTSDAQCYDTPPSPVPYTCYNPELSADFPKKFSDGSNDQVRNFSPTVNNYSLCVDADCITNPPSSGWYAVCARYKDNAENVSSRNYDSVNFASSQVNEILGDVEWDSDGACTYTANQKICGRYGSAKHCSAINLDVLSPGAPQQLRVNTTADTLISGPNVSTYTFDAGNPVGEDLGSGSVSWVNVTSARVRWVHPANPVPGSPITSVRYFLSNNYIPGSGAPSTMISSGTSGTLTTISTDGTGPYFDMTYNYSALPDGCKNVYVWLGDEAGNFSNIGNGSLSFNAGLFCYDGTKPNAVTTSFGVVNASPVKFYSSSKLTEYLSLDSGIAKKFNPATAGDADLSKNFRNVPITNGKTASGTNDFITVAWLPVTDPNGPNGGQVSGLATNGYKLCWSSVAGNCDVSVDLDDVHTQNGGGSGTAHQVYTLTAGQMDTLRGSPNVYYFYVEVRDKAGNVSDKSGLQQIIIDTAEPCWDPGPQTMACSVSLNNGIGTIDLTSPEAGLSLSTGMVTRISVNPAIKYLLCGDNGGGAEKCDLPFNGAAFAGGLVMNFGISASDGTNGSNFNTGPGTGSQGNVKFGLGIDVWNGTSSDESTIWFDDRLPVAPAVTPSLDIPKPLTNGNVSFNMHIFRGKTGLIYADYVSNPPKYEFDDPNCATDNNVCNVTHLKMTELDGLEVVRNVYVRLRDLAGNWSPHDGVTSKLIYQTFVVDTRPPARITQASVRPELWQGGSFYMTFREQTGGIEYSTDTVGWDSNILTRSVSNNSAFQLRYTHPVDLSAVSGVWHKFDTAPNASGYADTGAVFTGTTSGQVSFTAPHNYPRIYVWLKDTSGNPSTVAVPGINSYYSYVNNASQPCHDNGSGVVTFTGSQSTCRVVSFELPYDGTKPDASASMPYLLDASPASEISYANQPTFNFTGSVDNVQSKESGLRTSCLGPGTTNCTYQICYDTSAGACGNSVWANDPTGANANMSFTPSAALPDGNWFFSVRAYDKAGNMSDPSVSKQILIDTAPPCTAANGDTCQLTLAAGAYSTASTTISLFAHGNDAGAGVNALTIGEYYQVGATCYASFYTNAGTMSTPVVQACSGTLDFTLTRGGTPTVTNSILAVTPTNGAKNISDFVLSSGDAVKTVFVSFRDSAQQWSAPVSRSINYDSGPPPAVTAAIVVPSGWSSSDTFLVNLSFPTNDFSSQGAPSYGIGAVWTKLSSIPTSDNDGIRTPLASLVYNSGTGQYGVPVQSTITGARDVYIWLEDALGNKSMLNRVRVTVMYDGARPSTPQTVTIDPTSSTLQPVVSWQSANDVGSGLATSNTYRVCWDTVLGGCTYSAYTNNVTSYALTAAQTLTQNTWYFSVYSQDQVLLQSFESSPVTHVVGSNTPVIDYLGVGSYSGTTVSPAGGPEGEYTFAVLYSDPSNQIPSQYNVQIDLDGNGTFESSEIIPMVRQGSGPYYDNIFSNGEQFMVTVPITFPRFSNGQIRYRFAFASPSVTATAGTSGLSPGTDYFLTISNFKTDFDGVVQVRNNVQRPGGNRAVLILFKTPTESTTPIFMQIVARNGLLIRKLVNYQAYSSLGKNYVYWDTDSDSGEKVGSGVYFAVIEIGKQKFTEPIAVIR